MTSLKYEAKKLYYAENPQGEGTPLWTSVPLPLQEIYRTRTKELAPLLAYVWERGYSEGASGVSADDNPYYPSKLD